MLTDDVKRYAERSVLLWLATVGEDGKPNVSPKEVFAVEGDSHVLIANIASPTSVRNLRARPRACASFIDVFAQKGYKVTGPAAVIGRTDPAFEGRVAPLRAIAGDAFPIHGIIAVEAEAVQPIVAPSYRLFPDTTEESQVENALRAYGVRRREDG